MSAVPEESSCLNSERGSSPTNKSTSTYTRHSSADNNNNNSIRNSTITLEDINDEDLEPTDNTQTEFNERPPKPRAWLHNPNVCTMNSNHFNRKKRTNYRDLPTRRPPTCSLSSRTAESLNNNNRRSGCTESDQTTPPPPYDENENYCTYRHCHTNRNHRNSQGHRQPRHTCSTPVGQPSFVQIDNNNRVTTKIKATVTMEVEYSHPNAPTRY